MLQLMGGLRKSPHRVSFPYDSVMIALLPRVLAAVHGHSIEENVYDVSKTFLTS